MQIVLNNKDHHFHEGWQTQTKQYRCLELSLQRIELAITSVRSLLANHLVAFESQRACDHDQSVVVTPRVNLSFSSLYRFSRQFIDFIILTLFIIDS